MNHLPAPAMPRWLSAMVPFTRYRVAVGDYEMHVMERGAGRPVLCLHGNPTWGFLYRRVANRLWRKPYRMIMPDLIGLGFSSRPKRRIEHTLDRHAGWVGDLIDAMQLEDVIIVAQDWGGPIGLLAAARRSDRVRGLVLMNTVVGPPRTPVRATAFHRFSRMPIVSDAAFRVLGFPQVSLGMVQGDPGSIRRQVARAYRYPLRSLGCNAAPLELARMVPHAAHHSSMLPLSTCQEFFVDYPGPVELVWGTKDPILGSVGRHVKRLRPDANMTETSAGHFLQEEVPGAIAAAIARIGQA